MKAQITDYGIATTKTGNPQIMIKFNCEDGKSRTWYGSLKEGRAREITIDTLLRCGFKGDDVSVLAGGHTSGQLDHNVELELVIENEVGQDGKTYERIRWVNLPGGSGFKNAMTQDDAVQVLKGLNLKSDFAARKASAGRPKSTEEVLF